MKIKELFEANIKDFSDPDHRSGAYELEAKSRSDVLARDKLAIDSLNAIIKKYKFGAPLVIGEFVGVAGKYVKNSAPSETGKFKLTGDIVTKANITLGTDQVIKLTVVGLEVVDDKKLKEFSKVIQTTLADIHSSAGASNEPRFKTVTFRLGVISSYHDKKKVIKLKQVIEMIKDHPF